jgi:hypothetical protein
MGESAMGDPEFSLQLKMTVKGRDPAKGLRGILWLFVITLLLLAFVEGLPKYLLGLFFHLVGVH